MAAVDLSFPVSEAVLPLDHGYSLFSALANKLPAIHGSRWLAVHPFSGKPDGRGRLTLGRNAALRVRLAPERIPDLLPLAGAELEVAGARLALGFPTVHPLAPAASLDARLVMIKLTGAPTRADEASGRQVIDVDGFAERYRQELARQLARIGVEGVAELCGRRAVRVAGKAVVGYAVRVHGLSPAHSLRLQEHGVGGKRSMGCGVFRPTRG